MVLRMVLKSTCGCAGGIVKHQDVGFGEVEIAQPRQGYATCLVASMGDALVRYAWKWLNVVLLVLILLLCQV